MPSSRIQRETQTVQAIIRLFCRGQHGGVQELCPECRQLLDYVQQRLNRCPFQEGETTCARCPVHCYRPPMRQKIREIMRYAGPRMLTNHPALALAHWLDSRRKAPLPR